LASTTNTKPTLRATKIAAAGSIPASNPTPEAEAARAAGSHHLPVLASAAMRRYLYPDIRAYARFAAAPGREVLIA
jgi:hypothetical protein